MNKLQQHWAQYAHIQSLLRDRSADDDRGRGYEAALDLIVSTAGDDGGGPSDNEIWRAVSAASRRARYQRALLNKYRTAEPANDATLDQVHARQVLSELRRQVSRADWALLNAVASGKSYDALANRFKRTAGALRVRVMRLRQRLAAAA
ncbi:MAG TPA: hypothetical protein VM240_02680 [Verrucomicrobiae bacterium]|nr:hypothetical protein [Verrucomicrobiae bacterium]